MKKETYVGYEVHILDKMIGRKLQALFENENLSKLQSWIIRYLYEHREEIICQKDIEAQFHIARSTTTGALQGLEKNGYLIRESMDTDARLKRLILTEKSCNLQEQLIRTIEHMEDTLRKDISEEEIKIFLQVLQKMRSNMSPNQNAERSCLC